MKTEIKPLKKTLEELEKRNKKVAYRKDHFFQEVLGIREL